MSNTKTFLYIVFYYILPMVALYKYTDLGVGYSIGTVLAFWIISGNILDFVLDFRRSRKYNINIR